MSFLFLPWQMKVRKCYPSENKHHLWHLKQLSSLLYMMGFYELWQENREICIQVLGAKKQLSEKTISKPTEIFHRERMPSCQKLCHFLLLCFSSHNHASPSLRFMWLLKAFMNLPFLHGLQASVFLLFSYTSGNPLWRSWYPGKYLICFI